jgi:hypothetical protein
LTNKRNPSDNNGVPMIRPVFSVVIPQYSPAMGGDLHPEAIA